MATRSLTDVFMLMRNQVQRDRHYGNDFTSDRDALVEHGDEFNFESCVPPAWTDNLKECQFAILKLNDKIHELDDLHSKILHRPSFDDSRDGNAHQLIETLTREITRKFATCHTLVNAIKKQSNHGTIMEKRLAQNAMDSLVSSLQNSSNLFRTTQNNYLKTINRREETSREYALEQQPFQFQTWDVDNDVTSIDNTFQAGPSHSLTQTQLVLLEEDNTRVAAEREEEVKKIVKSIVDLNQIFKDLGQMVTEQGTVLDRIDYNLERTSMQVHQGLKQLQRAEVYQKKNMKLKCIIGLAITTILMFVLLVVFKLN